LRPALKAPQVAVGRQHPLLQGILRILVISEQPERTLVQGACVAAEQLFQRALIASETFANQAFLFTERLSFRGRFQNVLLKRADGLMSGGSGAFGRFLHEKHQRSHGKTDDGEEPEIVNVGEYSGLPGDGTVEESVSALCGVEDV